MARLTHPRSSTIAAVLLALGLASCASPGRRPAPVSSAERAEKNDGATVSPSRPAESPCDSLCEEITACAARAGHADLAPVLCSIARCETGRKCVGRIVSSNRKYKGAFQFAGPTWRARCIPLFERKGMISCKSAAAAHDPCCASACAAEMISEGRIGEWPVCGRRAVQEAKERGEELPPGAERLGALKRKKKKKTRRR